MSVNRIIAKVHIYRIAYKIASIKIRSPKFIYTILIDLLHPKKMFTAKLNQMVMRKYKIQICFVINWACYFFLIFLLGLANGVGDIWIGGNDMSREGHWYWDKGDIINYFNWYKGKRVHVNLFVSFQCAKNKNWICKF